MAKKFIIFACMSLLAGVRCSAEIITVDPNGSADYTTIQAAINDANDFDIVLVADGTYTGNGNRDIDFLGKAITVKSANGPANCIIDCQNSGRGFDFHSGEGPDSVLDGLTITNGSVYHFGGASGGGIIIDSSSPTIKNCVISGNSASGDDGALGGGMYLRDSLSLIDNCIISDNLVGADPMEFGSTAGGGISLAWSDVTIRNCIITGNSSLEGPGGGVDGGSFTSAPAITNCTIIDNKCETWSGLGEAFGGGLYVCNGPITNCIFWDNIAEDGGDQLYNSSTPTYSCIQDWTGGGVGNIDSNPLFAEPTGYDGYFDPNGTLTDPNDDFWIFLPVELDYHLKSESGRWDPNTESWVFDPNTSPCVDAGDPNSDWTGELWPHGKRINMGAYGGTAGTSMSLSDIGNIADLNNDDVVDLADFSIFGDEWPNTKVLLKQDLDRNGLMDLRDVSIMAINWLWAEQ